MTAVPNQSDKNPAKAARNRRMTDMTYPDAPNPGEDDEQPTIDELLDDARIPTTSQNWTQELRDQAEREGLEAIAEAAQRRKPTLDELLSRARLVNSGPEDPEAEERRAQARSAFEEQRKAWLASRTPAEIAEADQKRLELPNGLTLGENEDWLTYGDEMAAHLRELPDLRDLTWEMRRVDRRNQ